MENTIYELFQNMVRNHKKKPAIIENNRTLTYGELSDLTDMIAATFPKDIISVGIVMNHRGEVNAAILAVLK